MKLKMAVLLLCKVLLTDKINSVLLQLSSKHLYQDIETILFSSKNHGACTPSKFCCKKPRFFLREFVENVYKFAHSLPPGKFLSNQSNMYNL